MNVLAWLDWSELCLSYNRISWVWVCFHKGLNPTYEDSLDNNRKRGLPGYLRHWNFQQAQLNWDMNSFICRRGRLMLKVNDPKFTQTYVHPELVPACHIILTLIQITNRLKYYANRASSLPPLWWTQIRNSTFTWNKILFTEFSPIYTVIPVTFWFPTKILPYNQVLRETEREEKDGFHWRNTKSSSCWDKATVDGSVFGHSDDMDYDAHQRLLPKVAALLTCKV